MKGTLVLVIVAFSIALALGGCGQKETGTTGDDSAEPVHIKVGHVGHDHHLALFVAADNAEEYSAKTGINLKPVKDMKYYDLMKDGKKIADVEIVKVGGGSRMPTALAQNIIEVGFGGVAPVLASVDKDAPVRMISPLHYKGDMFVLKPDYPADTWEEFVKAAKEAAVPIRIGYKDPIAVAKIVFEEALAAEGIAFTGDPSNADAKILMVNVKGGGKLNTSLASGIIEGYVGNNPFPAIGREKGILKIISDLEDLSKGTFKDHPCCCIAGHTDAIQDKSEAIEALLVLFIQATDTINNDLDLAAASACKWIGVTEKVAKDSISTSGYSMEPSEDWMRRMDVWFNVMKDLGQFSGRLKDLEAKEVPAVAYDFTFLRNALGKLEE